MSYISEHGHEPFSLNDYLFLTISKNDRTGIATTIERLINMLDDMEDDCDLELSGDEYDFSRPESGAASVATSEDCEDCGDYEPTLGAPNSGNQEYWGKGSSQWDECEEENEHGGDIQDEPHDQIAEGDFEPFLGWTEASQQRGIEASEPFSLNVDMGDTNTITRDGDLCRFLGDGYVKGQKLLADLRKRRPNIHQNYVQLAPVYVEAWRV